MTYDFSKTSLASETSEVFAWLLEINHPSLTEPCRISSDRTELYDYDDDGNPIWCTRYNGNVYFTHEAFSFIPPGQSEDDEVPTARFVMSWNQKVMRGIADIHEHLTISGVYINVDEPDYPIQVLPTLLLTNVTATGTEISAELGIDHFLNEPAGRLEFDPYRFPALFRNAAVGQ